MAKQKPKLQVKIVLDTNAIWTGGENYLLRREMSELVRGNRGDAHLDIQWILPEVVLHERRYQMQREASALLPSLTRLERVIGHPLNITEEVIGERISSAVERQVQEHQLVVQPVSYDHIDWLRLVVDAVYRRPPFEAKSEKGFRDAIIAETFLQLVNASPEQPQRCRIILLTSDTLLGQTVEARISERKNAQVLRSADELRGLINTLISTIPEDYVLQLQRKAQDYFWRDGGADLGLVYDLKVLDAIQSHCKDQLEAKPEGITRRSNGPWHLTPPRFVKKEGQRVFWVSRFSPEAKAYKNNTQQTSEYKSILFADALTTDRTSWSPLLATINTGGTVTTSGSVPGFYGGGHPMDMISLGSLAVNEKLAATGYTVIDVNWSITINVKGVFSKPRIDSIEFVETTWETVI
jgi:PIN domain